MERFTSGCGPLLAAAFGIATARSPQSLWATTSDLNNVGMTTSQTVSGIPNGTIYVRLWSLIGSSFWYSDCTFTAVLVGDDFRSEQRRHDHQPDGKRDTEWNDLRPAVVPYWQQLLV